MLVCELCKAVSAGDTTVGSLIKEGDALRREGMRDNAKLMLALNKYHAAWKALSNNCENHTECVKCIDKDYEDVFRIIAGSRA